jgi:N-acyl-D-amino-acid deacylase
MEAVEDIPGSALSEGIQWEWETFPEYLDALGRREYGCDVAVMVGHGGVRTWCLGKRANVSDLPGGPEANPVSDAEIEAMASVVREAVAAGALGFSTSRLLLHRDNRGILTPGALAARKEMLRICEAVADGESFPCVHWVAVPQALRARRANRRRRGVRDVHRLLCLR